ncbi:APC family permease [Methanoculleus sp. 10]|jgi:amino acid transporter|uniref:APC family permease n=1 Tax=Methanoculleus sp. 10 TaxID=430615 RepID=UPI001B6EC719|nr:APC family permease [Methanoculleus sp. 10]MBP7410064.1 amino acid permease [Methanoculleus sp.]
MPGGTKRAEGLSLSAAIAFAVGNMIGAGVFVLSGLIIAIAGPSAVISYLLCGLVVAFSGLSYAALASIYPEDGGGYLYARRILGSYPGFLAGFAMYVSITIATAFVLLGFGIYANLLAGTDLDPRYAALAALALLAALNLRGAAEAGRLEIGLVAAKVAILAGLILVGLAHVQASDFSPFLPGGVGGMLRGVTMIFFAYIGFQVVAMMGGEVKSSARSVPLATLASIGIVALIYTGVIVALLAARLPSYGGESVFDASVVYLGPAGGVVVALAALFSTLSAANANILGASRIILEMASEEQIPGRFARIRNGQPASSILLGAGLTALLILAGNLSFIVELTNVTILIAMMLVNVSAFILARRRTLVSPGKSLFAIPFGPLFPLLGAASCAAILVTLAPPVLGLGIAILLAGSIFLLIEDVPERELIVREIRLLLRRPVERDGEG